MKSNKNPAITLSVLKDALAENNKALITIMDDRFHRQWMAVESKFNELREEMFAKFELADQKFDKIGKEIKAEFDKVNNKLNDIDEEIIFLDTKREDLEETLKIKNLTNKSFVVR